LLSFQYFYRPINEIPDNQRYVILPAPMNIGETTPKHRGPVANNRYVIPENLLVASLSGI
jgi:hypothetical protein